MCATCCSTKVEPASQILSAPCIPVYHFTMSVHKYDIQFLRACHWSMTLGWYTANISCMCPLKFMFSDSRHLAKNTKIWGHLWSCSTLKVDKSKGQTITYNLAKFHCLTLLILQTTAPQSRDSVKKKSPADLTQIQDKGWRHKLANSVTSLFLGMAPGI